MPCDHIKFPDGVTAIVCTRGRRAAKPRVCGACHRARATRLCDFPIPSKRRRKTPKTCDLDICESCSKTWSTAGPEALDLCPAHHEELVKRGTLASAPKPPPLLLRAGDLATQLRLFG